MDWCIPGTKYILLHDLVAEKTLAREMQSQKDREEGKQSWAQRRLYYRTKGFLQFVRLSSVVTEFLCHFINNEESPCSFTWSA